MSMRLMIVAAALVTLSDGLQSQQCMTPGYAIHVSAADGASLDSAYLSHAARTVALRWATPSLRRADFVNLRRVRERAIPEVPRWADDWRPVESNRATVTLVLRRRGRPTLSGPSPGSGDRLFDQSLASIVRDPIPASPELPGIPASVSADTLALRIEFGAQPESLVPGVIRFASVQDDVILVPGTLIVNYTQRTPTTLRDPNAAGGPGQPLTATVKYDVTAEGTVDPRSIQVLDSGDREFTRAVTDAVARARFTPATTNCQPIRVSVIQRFGS
jgi:TonB family protein